MALCIFVSTRLMRSTYRFRWYDAAVGTAGVALACLTLRGHIVNGAVSSGCSTAIRLGVGLAAILLYCSAVFYLNGHRRGSLAFQVLAVSLALWAVLMGVGQLQNPLGGEMFGNASRLFGPVPQMLLGIAMVMVLFENQRNAVQENTLALSTLGVDPRRLLFADDLVPSMQAALERLMSALPDAPRRHLHHRALARTVALGAAGIFAEVSRRARAQRRRRLHLRTRLPPQRNLHRA